MIKWINDHLEEFVMTVLLFLITAIITYAVIMRYVFNDSPSWAEEVTRFIFIWSAFLSISLCIKRQSSIRIDILLNVLSERGRTVLLMCVNIFVAVVLAYWLKGAVNVTRTQIGRAHV
jgi:TRAP-type C4-dicarboxylate transport system permease small subunit